jgi:hypothetical protein
MLLTAGFATAGLLLDNKTEMLFGAAAHSNVTVPVAGLGPVAGFGLTSTSSGPMRRTWSDFVSVDPLSVALTWPLFVAVTGTVLIAKVASRTPAGMVRDAGTLAAGFVSARVTTTPPDGAGSTSVTFPIPSEHPPGRAEGVKKVSEYRRTAFSTISTVEAVRELAVA